MLLKAINDHFDIGILLCGDKDFIPIVQAVKDQTGKRVFGAFFKDHCPPDLRRAFDEYYQITYGHESFHDFSF